MMLGSQEELRVESQTMILLHGGQKSRLFISKDHKLNLLDSDLLYENTCSLTFVGHLALRRSLGLKLGS